MGLLDDAIREHLDLKRRGGGDPAEIERLEREALGPVRREPSIYSGSTAVSDEPPPYTDAPVTGAIEDVHSPEHEPRADGPSFYETGEHATREAFPDEPAQRRAAARAEPKKPRRFLRGLAALSGAPTEEDRNADYDPVQPIPARERPQPAPLAGEPVGPSAPSNEPPRLTLSGETLVEPEADVSVPAPAPAVEPEAPADEQATQVHRLPPPAPAEPEQPAAPAPAPDPAPAAAPDEPSAPGEPSTPVEEDPLEETPEFLQDTPEHDRLWFEQRPPRDFDFDG
jgi:hypothetical protein